MLKDEKSLIKKAKGGESEAFGLLYDYYLPKIYRFVLIKVGHREEAEDLTHQVFLKAWTSIDSYKHKGHPFGSWLYQISRNIVIDHYRSVGRSKVEVSSEGLDDALSEESNIDSDLDSKLSFGKVMNAIGKLKDTEQDVLIMRFVDEMPHEEVAEVVEKSVGATKVIQHRALKNLKEILENDR